MTDSSSGDASGSRLGWLWGLGLLAVPVVSMIAFSLSEDPPKELPPAELEPTGEEGIPVPAPTRRPAAAPRPVPAPEPVEPASHAMDDDSTEEEAEGAEPSEGASEQSRKAAQMVEQAKQLSTTDPDKARQLLKDALFYDPDNVDALTDLAKKMLLDENHREAADLADRCKRLDAESEACRLVDEISLKDAPAVPLMLKATKQCLAERPEDVNCLNSMANYHLMHGRMSDAKSFGDQMLQADPESPLSQLVRGRLSAAEGDFSEALSYFDSGCRGGDPQACFRAEVLRDEGWKPHVEE